MNVVAVSGEAYVTKDVDKAIDTVTVCIQYLKTDKGLYIGNKGSRIYIKRS